MCNMTTTSKQQNSRSIGLTQTSSVQDRLIEDSNKTPRRRRVKQLSSLEGFLLESDISSHCSIANNESMSLSSDSFDSNDSSRHSISSLSSCLTNSSMIITTPKLMDVNGYDEGSNHIRILAREIRRAKRRTLLNLSQQEV
jgi:hypothetical protein